jgi:hypothetical protein
MASVVEKWFIVEARRDDTDDWTYVVARRTKRAATSHANTLRSQLAPLLEFRVNERVAKYETL